MTDLASVAQIALVLAAVTVPIVAAIRLLGGGPDAPASAGWPRGVQEPEPVRFRFPPLGPAGAVA